MTNPYDQEFQYYVESFHQFEEPEQQEEEEEQLNPLEMLSVIFDGKFDTDTLIEALRSNGLDFDSTYDFLCGLAELEDPNFVPPSIPPKQQQQQQKQQNPIQILQRPQKQSALPSASLPPTLPVSKPLSPSSQSFIPRNEQPKQQQTTAQYHVPTQVCTHWLNGTCRVVNCPYLHTTVGVKCRFFETGFCAKGENCLYLHESLDEQNLRLAKLNGARGDLWIPPPQTQSTTQNQTNQKPSPENFPPLGSSSPQKEQVASGGEEKEEEEQEEEEEEVEDEELGPDRVKELNAAERVKLGELKKQFWWISKEIVETIFRESDLSVENASKILVDTYGSQPPPGIKPPTKKKEEKEEEEEEEKEDSADTETDKTKRRGYKGKVPGKWVETGERVSEVYEKTRNEAIIHAQMRNFHFRMATQAYLSGNRAEAKEHSRIGRFHDECMRQLHEKAKNEIIEQRNPRFKDLINETKEQVIDLHGLHGREVIDLLTGILVNTKTSKARIVYVITGTGHHSSDGKGVLASIVVDFLNNNKQLKFMDCSADKSGGMFRIIVPPSSSTQQTTANNKT